MVRKHYSIRRRGTSFGLAAELDGLSDNFRRGVFQMAKEYEEAGVRFALIGGLAVGSYGEPRATRDIDFLVGDEAFLKTGLLIKYAFPFSLQFADIAIDTVSMPEPEIDPVQFEILQRALSKPNIDTTTGVPIPVLPAAALAYMKLVVGRSKDRGDVVSMMRTGAVDLDELGSMVAGDARLEAKFDAAVAEAEED